MESFVFEIDGRTFDVTVEHDSDDGGNFVTLDIQARDGNRVTFKERTLITQYYLDD